jgi:hypothetical protein
MRLPSDLSAFLKLPAVSPRERQLNQLLTKIADRHAQLMFDIRLQIGREAAGVNRMAKARRFNVSDYLDDGRRMIAAYLSEAFRSGDVRLIAKAIGALARALIAQVKSPYRGS